MTLRKIKAIDRSFRSLHPKNLGHQVGPVLPFVALADLAGSFLDIGNGVYEVGNPATPMERVVIKEFARKLGLPIESDGILTSGGSLGNLTALLVMRQRNFAKRVTKRLRFSSPKKRTTAFPGPSKSWGGGTKRSFKCRSIQISDFRLRRFTMDTKSYSQRVAK